MSDEGTIASLLARARALAAGGEDDAAKAAYLEILKRDATHFDALNELGTLAYASGHRSAAHSAYEQAVTCHPGNPIGRVNLGNLLFEEERFAAARMHYEAALAADPDCAPAHQGLARVLTELGQSEAAAPHWEKGFAGHALIEQRCRGAAPAVPVLLLVSAKGGNIPTRRFLDDQIFAVSALYAEYWDRDAPLPPHALLFNAIGDADLCGEALARAVEIAAHSKAQIINPPRQVRKTGRAENAQGLAKLPGVIAPQIAALARDAIAAAPDLRFPLLLRAPGYHTGRHFIKVDRREDLAAAVAALPGEELLAIEHLDARGADGLYRKYRVMIVDGALYPLHLAISRDWKVHYFTADMAANAAYRDEERRFLEAMPETLGPRALGALAAIAKTLCLDYAGVDFALDQDGALLLFEANATMVINPPEADPLWDYRRPAIARALDAATHMLLARAKL